MSSVDQLSVQYIKGVGPARKKLFANLGVESVGDLFYLFPRRYEDRRNLTPLAKVVVGEFQTVCVTVVSQNARRSWYTKKHVHEILVGDETGQLTCVWFNQHYLAHYFKPGRRAVLYGKVEIYKNRLQMISPEYEILEGDDAGLNINRIVPIYPLTRGMSQRYLRKIMMAAIETYQDRLEDILPVVIRNKYRLPNIRHSIRDLHFPPEMKAQEEAFRRISFEEFFLFQLSVLKRRMRIIGRPGFAHTIAPELIDEFSAAFPFELTGSQRRVINEIARDLQNESPMLRLLQGDVGCGKTLVSLFACVAAVRNGHQAAMMAPTEILATQHFHSLGALLAAGVFKDIRLGLLIGGMTAKQKEAVHQQLANGDIDLVIGTHALLSDPVAFKDLSVVVIDEQHKFGVRQRALLSAKGKNPDVLVMTATPIPRTLSLTLFGDLDVSIIDEMPKGRGKVTTRLFDMEKADEVYAKVGQAMAAGQQAYVVYPVVQESEKLDLKAAEEMAETFRAKTFKNFRVGIVHGQMKRSLLDETMTRFKNHDLDLLVATTVLEVGVDVPNANVLIIEHADRFGISQLHQLRGRIGRGKEDAQCFLLADPVTEEGLARLKAVVETRDGFVLAEKDLEIRGPGHYFGRHQHGMNELRFVNPLRQIDILKQARDEAQDVIGRDPKLVEPNHQVLMRTIRQRYPGYLEHIEAG